MKKKHKIPPPKSLDAAFAQIEGGELDPPTKAVEYLRKHPTDERIIEKIIFYFENAYVEDKSGMWSQAPLWYSFVAEKHLDIRLVEAVTCLYKIDGGGGDFLNEQGSYLTGALCEKFGDAAVSKFMAYIESEVACKSKRSYQFMFDCVHYADLKQYKERILNFLHQDPYWVDVLISDIGHLQIKEAIPIFRKMMAEESEGSHTLIELKEALEELETGVCKYPSVSKSWFKQRPDWRNYGHLFKPRIKTTFKSLLPGRNDPCFCGSGKKYKKCHMKKA